MSSIINLILQCLNGDSTSSAMQTYHPVAFPIDEKLHPAQYQPSHNRQDEEAMATDIVDILRMATESGEALRSRLHTIIRAQGWTDNLVQSILARLVRLIQYSRDKIGPVMKEALEMAEQAADDLFQFAKENPKTFAGYLTIVAIGILVVMYAPWLVEALGFAELGPLEGSFAAWWESTYAGHIPAGSLFSFLQRLGMTWGKAALSARL